MNHFAMRSKSATRRWLPLPCAQPLKSSRAKAATTANQASISSNRLRSARQGGKGEALKVPLPSQPPRLQHCAGSRILSRTMQTDFLNNRVLFFLSPLIRNKTCQEQLSGMVAKQRD